jgi:hypothetical protein
VQLTYKVKTFKSLRACLGECEKFIRQPQYLYTGEQNRAIRLDVAERDLGQLDSSRHLQ